VAKARKLTELEGCILGLVWAEGPCSAYNLRKQIQSSPNPNWSASAGAIYPLVERLQARKLIRATAHAQGRRHSKRYVVTQAGSKKLCEWMAPPLSEELVGVPVDPLRTRLYFLGALPKAQQTVFFSDAERGIREQTRIVERDLAKSVAKDRIAAFAARGALAALHARLAWIRDVATEWNTD
jgi:DNA-binding PadR family transcriptional regulator